MNWRRSRPQGWRVVAVLGVVSLIAALGAGIGMAAIPDSADHVHACFNNNRGTWRVIDPEGTAGLDTACDAGRETQVDLLAAAGKAADSDQLDGLDSTAFYEAGSKVADSDLIDGLDSTALAGGFDAQTVTTSTPLTTTVTDVATITVNAPSAGFVILTGNGMFQASHTNGTNDFLRVWLTDASGTANFNNLTFYEVPASAPTGVYGVPFSITRIFPISAGGNSFYMTADKNSGSGALIRHNLTGVFTATQL